MFKTSSAKGEKTALLRQPPLCHDRFDRPRLDDPARNLTCGAGRVERLEFLLGDARLEDAGNRRRVGLALARSRAVGRLLGVVVRGLVVGLLLRLVTVGCLLELAIRRRLLLLLLGLAVPSSRTVSSGRGRSRAGASVELRGRAVLLLLGLLAVLLGRLTVRLLVLVLGLAVLLLLLRRKSGLAIRLLLRRRPAKRLVRVLLIVSRLLLLLTATRGLAEGVTGGTGDGGGCELAGGGRQEGRDERALRAGGKGAGTDFGCERLDGGKRRV